MKPAPFEYVRAASVAEAVDALTASDGEAKLLAGGQSLVPLLAMRLAQPTVLVDLNRVDGLAGVESVGPARVRFGAMTRQRDLIAQPHHRLVAEATAWVGHAAIRTRGTIGGSLAHADPSAELPAVAVATDAVVHAWGPSGQRDIAVASFFETMLQTTLADDEVLTSVDMQVPLRHGLAEMARREGDFALVLAVVAELVDGWRVVIGGVGPTPWRCVAAEAALAAGDAAAVATAVRDTVTAFDDLHASAEYRRAMAGHFAQRAAARALAMPPRELR